MANTFWMIYGEGASGPTVRHHKLDDAKREAARLARMSRGAKFFILQAVTAVSVNDVVYEELDEIPF